MLPFGNLNFTIHRMFVIQFFQARNIRKDVESKLPNGALCQHQQSSNANMMAIRQKAESLLSNIVKHLVALKEGDGRLSDEAKRSYLQVSDLCFDFKPIRIGA